jgi:hypothetical protein
MSACAIRAIPTIITYPDEGEVKKTDANMRTGAYERPWQLWKREAMGK